MHRKRPPGDVYKKRGNEWKGKERKIKNLNCTLKDLGGNHVEKSKLSNM